MRKIAAILLGGVAWTFCAAAGEWALAPVKGNQPNVWAAGENWTHARGNPLKVEGGEWLLAYQDKDDPAPEEPYLPMRNGTYVDYHYVWKAGDAVERDPRLCYRGTTLSARPAAAGVHLSPAAAILFAPAAAGNYRLAITGDVSVQSPSAGYARLLLGVLAADGKTFRTLQDDKRNSDKPGAFGAYPAKYQIAQTVALAAGERLVLRLQTASPGNASAGTSSLTLREFRIIRE